MSYFQAIVIGLFQGVTELVPISSLGHSVLLPAWFGWDNIVKAQSADESFYLAFLVALHVGTAIALIIYFRHEWDRVIRGGLISLRTRRVDGPDQRMAWLLVVATIPVGLVGVTFEHSLRTVFAKPVAAALFLMLNGVLLLAGERYRVQAHARSLETGGGTRQLDTLEYREAGAVGIAQTGALFAGISRSGITMIAGLARGMNHEDAARFAFLLATPVILAAGVYKIPDLLGHLGDGVRGQAAVGAVVAGCAAYASTRFLVRFFETKTLRPFAVYSLIFGAASFLYLR